MEKSFLYSVGDQETFSDISRLLLGGNIEFAIKLGTDFLAESSKPDQGAYGGPFPIELYVPENALAAARDILYKKPSA